MRSSQAAVNLIVAEEVSSKEVYIKKYQRPEWPGGASGITVGIGYDLGYSTAGQVLLDWKDYLPPDVVRAMQEYAGITNGRAQALLHEARPRILVPWDAAMTVFMKHVMPKWEAKVLRAVPGSEKLPAGCFGVLTSLAYNRGDGGFNKAGDRYLELRNIRSHVASGQWERVPAELRAMKRLWPQVAGLRKRRENEAVLWEKSLAAAPKQDQEEVHVPVRVDTGDDRNEDVTPAGNTPETSLNVQPTGAVYSMEVELIQRALIDFKYFEVGDPDGLMGGKFVAGVAAFMTDRGKDPNKGRLTPELKAELELAKAERLPDGRPWSRPIAPSRANATAKDISTKVESVNLTWWQKTWAFILGIPSAAVALFKSLFGDYNDPSSYIFQVKSLFAAIPTELYFLVIAGIAAAIFWQAKKAQDATVKDYQQGKIN